MIVREPEQVPQGSGVIAVGIERWPVDSRKQVDGEGQSIAYLRRLPHPRQHRAYVAEVLVGVRIRNLLHAAFEERNVSGDCPPALPVERAILVPPHLHEEAQEESPLSGRES